MRTAGVFMFLLLNMGMEISGAFLGNLLVVPMDGSPWVGFKAIAQEMGRRGHRVTVVMPETTIRMGPGKHYDTLTYPVPYDKTYIDSVMSKHKDIMKKSSQPFMEKIKKRFTQFQAISDFLHITAEKLLFNASELLCTQIICLLVHLGIPCHLDMKSAGCPSPPSYVPRFFTGYTDKMSFKERLINTLVRQPLFCRLLYWRFDQITRDFLGENVGVAEVTSLYLNRSDFTLDFPRPLMPNIVLVGGINCNVKHPLPPDLDSWVSGQHGFVVFTLGSMVSDLPEEITSVFLEAFRQIPQKVIWRYTGKVPDNVPENVKMMKWVPQNDLLAHPGARAFITHAGSHGVFEGLCHAVPMLMVPRNGDQPDNAARMASRGVGIVLNILDINTETLLKGLKEVINDSRYKENVKKLSDLHNDRLSDPLELSVYWTEFVMRHKGAKHLKSALHELYWFQYFSLDVIALLTTVVLVFVMLTAKCMKLCFRKLRRKRKQE
uniref:UDP-glucuronosyltransferase n=1 Tax=Oreochromis niloticus TaxID=8128 RepID=A0A669BH88_ORENI